MRVTVIKNQPDYFIWGEASFVTRYECCETRSLGRCSACTPSIWHFLETTVPHNFPESGGNAVRFAMAGGRPLARTSTGVGP